MPADPRFVSTALPVVAHIVGAMVFVLVGAQAFTEGISIAAFGEGELLSDIAKGTGWVINLALAEWIIRRGASSPATLTSGART